MAGLKSALQIGPSGPRVRSRHAGEAKTRRDGEKKKRPSLDVVWREARELVWAHRSRLGLGFLLMIINRLAGLVLPASSKWLIDEVVDKSRADLLIPIALAAGAATAVQGATAFALSLVLGVAAQRSITDMRLAVQRHVERLPVRYFDSTKTGVLISRIMSDAEGIRNLVGNGIVQLVGSLLTAVDRARRALLAQLAAHDHHPGAACDLRRRDGDGVHAPAAAVPRARRPERRGHGPARGITRRHPHRQGLYRGAARGPGVREGRPQAVQEHREVDGGCVDRVGGVHAHRRHHRRADDRRRGPRDPRGHDDAWRVRDVRLLHRAWSPRHWSRSRRSAPRSPTPSPGSIASGKSGR